MSGDHNNSISHILRNSATTSRQALLDAIDEATNHDDNLDRGATMVEYGVMLILVLVVAFLSVKFFGDTIVGVFETGNAAIEDAPELPASE